MNISNDVNKIQGPYSESSFYGNEQFSIREIVKNIIHENKNILEKANFNTGIGKEVVNQKDELILNEANIHENEKNQ